MIVPHSPWSQGGRSLRFRIDYWLSLCNCFKYKGKCLLPVRHPHPKSLFDTSAGQARIGWPPSQLRIFVRFNRDEAGNRNPQPVMGTCQKGLGKPVPGRLALASQIVDAAAAADPPPGREHLRQHVSRRLRDALARRGRSNLVVYDAQFVTFPRKTQHCQEEIVATGAVYPTRPKNQVVASRSLNCLVSSQFRSSVNIERARRIGFDPPPPPACRRRTHNPSNNAQGDCPFAELLPRAHAVHPH